jgi:hypothetical protein
MLGDCLVPSSIAAAARASFRGGTNCTQRVIMRHDISIFFLQERAGKNPQSCNACLFSKVTAPTRGNESTTRHHFLGNKRLGTFQITDSRLRDQTTVGSNYQLGEERRGLNWSLERRL